MPEPPLNWLRKLDEVNMNSKISIIVPIYNVEKYLEQCIDSLLHQTYTDTEIILVDDGSKDKSSAICDKYAKIDNRIIVIHKNNEGLGYARNSGLEIATGKYVTFIDSDDYADFNMIENLVTAANRNKADTVIGGYKKVDDEGTLLFDEKYNEKIFKDSEVYNNFFSRILGASPNKHDAFRMSVWNGLYSLKIIRENNIKFPSEREFISEDLIFDLEYYKHSKCVSVIEDNSYNYRCNPNSLTQKYKKNKFKMVNDLYNEVSKILKENMCSNDQLLRLQKMYFVNVRECISQEKRNRSKLNFFDQYKNIKEICNNDLLLKIASGYPVKLLGVKQKFFINCLIKQRILVLIFCLELGTL